MKKCVKCQKEFKQYHIINNKKIRLRNRSKCLECMPYKSKDERSLIRIKIKCKNCNKMIKKAIAKNNISKNHFCSRSCAVSYNNKNKAKKQLTKKCKNCGTLIYASHINCRSCINLGKHLTNGGFIKDNCLSDYLHSSDSNRYRSIRDHARKITFKRIQKCHICDYDKHIETCHIKEIKEFSPSTKIKEINSHSNLVLLCGNHHWELDNKYLSILKWTLSDSN